MAAVALLLSACGDASTGFPGLPLEEGVRFLLARENIGATGLDCRMSSRQRDGTCSFTLTAEQHDRLIAGMALRPASNDEGQRLLHFVARNRDISCWKSKTFHGSRSSVHYLAGRPQALQLPDGTNFEYLVLYFDNHGGSGCVDITYAYG